MNKKVLVFLAMFAVFLIVSMIPGAAANSEAAGNWWNDNWSYRNSFYANVSPTSSLVNYPVGVNITLTSNYSSDCSDIRFVTNSSSTAALLSAYLYNNVTSQFCYFYVKIPTFNYTAWVYYNSIGAALNSNGSAVFEFYENFDTYNKGDLNGQGGWIGSVSFDVVTDQARSGTQSVVINASSSSISAQSNFNYTMMRFWFSVYADSVANSPSDYICGLNDTYNEIIGSCIQTGRTTSFQKGGTGAWANLETTTTQSAATWYDLYNAWDLVNDKWVFININGVNKDIDTAGDTKTDAFERILMGTGGGTSTDRKYMDTIMATNYTTLTISGLTLLGEAAKGNGDTTPPVITWVTTNGTESANQTYSVFNVSLSENASYCYFEVNGTANTSATAIVNGTTAYCYYNNTGLSGNVTRCVQLVYAADGSNNVGNITTTICRNTNIQSDNTPPTLSWIAPVANNGTLTTNQTYIVWNISATEYMGICEFVINGTSHSGTISNNTLTYCYYNETSLSGNVTRCSKAYGTDEFNNTGTITTTRCMNTNEQQPTFANMTVTIGYPFNTTNFYSNLQTDFLVEEQNGGTSFLCFEWFDGVFYGSGMVQNYTWTYRVHFFRPPGYYNISVMCVGQSGNVTETRWYTVGLMNITNISYSEQVFETNQYYYNLSMIYNPDEVNHINASLYWNGTNKYNDIVTVNNTANTTNILSSNIPGLAAVNNTNNTFRFVINVSYLNGSFDVFNSSDYYQNVTFAYDIDDIAAAGSVYLEDDDVPIDFYINDYGGLATLATNISFMNQTEYVDSSVKIGTTRTFSTSINTGWVGSPGAEYDYNGTLYVTYNGYTRTSQSSTHNVTVSSLFLDACNDTFNVTTLTMWLMDEENSSLLNGSVEIQLTAWSTLEFRHEYSWSFTGENNFSICLEPNVTYHADAVIQYTSPGYSPRNYFLANASLSDNATDLYFYLEDSDLGDTIIIYVKDASNNNVPSAIVKILRYYIGNNSYNTVAMVRTDFEGKGSTFLRTSDVWYSYIIEVNGSVAKEFSPSILVCLDTPCTLILTLDPESSRIWDFWNSIAYNCTVNMATRVFRCTFSDLTGLMTEITMLVQEQLPLSFETVCNSNSTSSSSILVCDLDDSLNGTYRYTLVASVTGYDQELAADYVTFGMSELWGSTGLLLTFIIVTIMSMVGLAIDPKAVLIGGIFGYIISFILSLIVIQPGLLIGLAISVGLVVVKMKRSG